MTLRALVIPVSGPLYEIEVGRPDGADLEVLQAAVGGRIEALSIPGFVGGSAAATAYVNEDGKSVCRTEDGSVAVNMRATDFMVPGVGLRFGDYIAGPMVLCGFDPGSGKHAELPQPVIDRARLIEQEAGPSAPEVGREAEAERRMLGLLSDAGLPTPDEVQHGDGEVRFLWHDHKVAVVVDLDGEVSDDRA